MKRTISTLAVAALLGGLLAGCSSDKTETSSSPQARPASSASTASSNAPTSTDQQGTGKLTEKDGKLTASDPKATALKDVGFDITIDPAAKTALFQHVDPKTGEPFKNHSKFDYKANTFERLVFVSAMGATFVYTMDLKTNKLLKIADAEGKDVSAPVRKQGRWDKAEADTVKEHEAIEKYFADTYGQPLEKAAMQA